MQIERLTQKKIRQDGDGTYLDPNAIIERHPLKIESLKKLAGESILSAKFFDLKMLRELCTFASYLEGTQIASYHPLDDKIIITAFFEASTRTRLSCESAAMRLGSKVLSIPDGQVTGIAKGESLQDIGEMFNSYGDLVVLRHTETNSIDQLRQNLRVPLINAGNGSGEHPTQALADWYALLKWNPALYQDDTKNFKKLHLGIIGTPGNMRAVKSFLLMGLLFKNYIGQLTIVSEMADPFGDIEEDVRKSEINFEVVHDLNQVIKDIDIIYMNSIALLGDSYKKLDQRFKITPETPLKKEAVILHPLARGNEIDPRIDASSHNLYFNQASGAVYIRQALLISIFGRFDRFPENLIEM